MTNSPEPLVIALNDVLNLIEDLSDGYRSVSANWAQDNGELRSLTLSVSPPSWDEGTDEEGDE